MDYFEIYAGEYTVAKDLRPKWTCWKSATVTADKQAHKRKARRVYRHYLKTGDVRIFNRSQKKLTRWDFDQEAKMLQHALFFMYGLTQQPKKKDPDPIPVPVEEEDEKKDLTLIEKHYINMFRD